MTRQYRKRPVVIEAIQFTEDSKFDVMEFITCNYACDWDVDNNKIIEIQTLEGVVTASLNDWIIKGVQGEFYPCKPDIFDATYEPVGEDNG